MAIDSDLPLVSTVATGFGLAFICGMMAAKLRISPIVGYLVAGIVIGPHTPGFVADIDLAHQLSEIGIVLLMFGVGLHFSLKDLMKVRKIAVTGAIIQMGITTIIGTALALSWGWSQASGLLFGLSLSVASTVVLLRALEDQNAQNTIDGKIAVGWLIVEDIVMILALVLIPALAAAGEEGSAGGVGIPLLIALGKAGLFVVVMELAGRRILPRVLSMVATTGSRELFTLAVITAAIGVAFGAAHLFGVSLALGAFFAGMLIKESDLNSRVAAHALPFQDAFAVLFFVAVGMLFNPAVLLQAPVHVLLTTIIIILVKFFAAFVVISFFRYPLSTRITVSSGLAQIGEFSFILVGLGLIYGLLPEEGRDLILAGSLMSIALNPATFYLSKKLQAYINERPALALKFNTRDDDLAHLRGEEKTVLRDMVVVAGYGELGRQIFRDVHDAHIELVVVDHNRGIIEDLRKDGFHAIAGDAGLIETLKEAALEKAAAIAVAVRDPYEARRVVDAARAVKPDIKILVRAYNDEEYEYYNEKQVDLNLMGRREIGRRMVEYLNEMRHRHGSKSSTG